MNKIKAIIFDSDGVINPFPTKKFSSRFKEEFPEQLNIMDFFEDGTYSKCRKGLSTIEKELPKYLKNTNWTLNKILDYWHKGDHGVDKKILNYVDKLKNKGIITILATNQAACRTKYMLENMNFEKYFDIIIASCDIFNEKPELEFYEKSQEIIYQKYSIKKEEILFFDDTLENVESGNNFGWKSFLYSDFNEFKKTIKKYIVLN